MANYYIRTTGNDANNGLTPTTAWASIGRALTGALAGGDTVYIGAGTYRSTGDFVRIDQPESEVRFIGDTDGVQTGDAGEVLYTFYSDLDKNGAPNPFNTKALLNLNNRSHLTFEHITFMGAWSPLVLAGHIVPNNSSAAGTSRHITFRDCAFIMLGRSNCIRCYVGASDGDPSLGTTAHWLIERCVFWNQARPSIRIFFIQFSQPHNAGITIRNCEFTGAASVGIALNGGTDKSGGVAILNCTYVGSFPFLSVAANGWRHGDLIPCRVFGCLVFSGGDYAIRLNMPSGYLLEDYNVFVSNRTGPVVWTPEYEHVHGQHTIIRHQYAPMIHVGQELRVGRRSRPYLMPTDGSPFLGFGAYDDMPAIDGISNPRPFGGKITPAVGFLERSDTGRREELITKTGRPSLRLDGPGAQDFELAVAAASYAVRVFARYNDQYAGPAPRMQILNGSEAGVQPVESAMSAPADTWEELEVLFTPNKAGIVTVRVENRSTAEQGAAYFSDFSVA